MLAFLRLLPLSTAMSLWSFIFGESSVHGGSVITLQDGRGAKGSTRESPLRRLCRTSKRMS